MNELTAPVQKNPPGTTPDSRKSSAVFPGASASSGSTSSRTEKGGEHQWFSSVWQSLLSEDETRGASNDGEKNTEQPGAQADGNASGQGSSSAGVVNNDKAGADQQTPASGATSQTIPGSFLGMSSESGSQDTEGVYPGVNITGEEGGRNRPVAGEQGGQAVKSEENEKSNPEGKSEVDQQVSQGVTSEEEQQVNLEGETQEEQQVSPEMKSEELQQVNPEGEAVSKQPPVSEGTSEDKQKVKPEGNQGERNVTFSNNKESAERYESFMPGRTLFTRAEYKDPEAEGSQNDNQETIRFAASGESVRVSLNGSSASAEQSGSVIKTTLAGMQLHETDGLKEAVKTNGQTEELKEEVKTNGQTIGLKEEPKTNAQAIRLMQLWDLNATSDSEVSRSPAPAEETRDFLQRMEQLLRLSSSSGKGKDSLTGDPGKNVGADAENQPRALRYEAHIKAFTERSESAVPPRIPVIIGGKGGDRVPAHSIISINPAPAGANAGDWTSAKEKEFEWKNVMVVEYDSGKTTDEEKREATASYSRLAHLPVNNADLRRELMSGLTRYVQQTRDADQSKQGSWQNHRFTMDDGKNIRISVREMDGILQLKLGSSNTELGRLLHNHYQEIRDHLEKECGITIDLQLDGKGPDEFAGFFDDSSGENGSQRNETPFRDRAEPLRIGKVAPQTIRDFGYNQMEWTA